MWSEFSVKPPAALSTPSIFEIFTTSVAGIESCAFDTKVSRENFSPGSPGSADRNDHRRSLTQLLALLVGKPPERPVARVGELDRPRHDMSVPTPVSGSRTWPARVETVGERGDGDDEADADAKAERREDRAAEPPPQLRYHVGDVEHGRTKPAFVRVG